MFNVTRVRNCILQLWQLGKIAASAEPDLQISDACPAEDREVQLARAHCSMRLEIASRRRGSACAGYSKAMPSAAQAYGPAGCTEPWRDATREAFLEIKS